MSSEQVAEKATSLFLEGYLCSESVLLAFSEKYEIKNTLIPKIATAFGAGFGRKGLVCGCVTGALMVIGMKYGRANSSETVDKAFEASRKFCELFERKFGSLFCRELTGIDLSTTIGRKMFAEKRVKEKKCANFVKEAANMLNYLIE